MASVVAAGEAEAVAVERRRTMTFPRSEVALPPHPPATISQLWVAAPRKRLPYSSAALAVWDVGVVKREPTAIKDRKRFRFSSPDCRTVDQPPNQLHNTVYNTTSNSRKCIHSSSSRYNNNNNNNSRYNNNNSNSSSSSINSSRDKNNRGRCRRRNRLRDPCISPKEM